MAESEIDVTSTEPPPRGPRREPPSLPGYRMVAHVQLAIGWVTVAGLATIPFWFALFNLLTAALGGRPVTGGRIGFVTVILGLLVALVLVPVLHEAVHGVVAMLAGARPAYGIGPGYAYTTFREPVGRGAYLAIGLAPLVVLSVLGVALMVVAPSLGGYALLFLVANASGAAGDLWMVWKLLHLPSHVRIYDLADGFAAYEPERTPLTP